MFNFLCFIKDGETVALLTDGGYNVTFRNSDRRTSINASTPASTDSEQRRYSVSRCVHNEKRIGALYNDTIQYVD